MERPHGAKMEDWQLGDLFSGDGSAAGLVVHEALQQSVNRQALPLGFLPDSCFGLWRDVETHTNSSILEFTVLSYAHLAALSRLPCSSYCGRRLHRFMFPGPSPPRQAGTGAGSRTVS